MKQGLLKINCCSINCNFWAQLMDCQYVQLKLIDWKCLQSIAIKSIISKLVLRIKFQQQWHAEKCIYDALLVVMLKKTKFNSKPRNRHKNRIRVLEESGILKRIILFVILCLESILRIGYFPFRHA